MKKMIPLLALIIISSGCIQNEVELPQDILKIETLGVIPETPVADSTFTVTFLITNMDEIKEIENVKLTVYDSGMCECDSCVASTGLAKQIDKIYPMSTEEIELTFKAPTNRELGNMPGRCSIKYKLAYDFNAETLTEVVVINENKLEELQKAGETASVSPKTIIGKGPIKIRTEIKEKQPILMDTTVPIIFNIENKGTGTFAVQPGKELNISSGKIGMNCQEKTVSLINGKILPIACQLTTPYVDDMKTFYIKTSLPYRYSVQGEIDVDIKPEYKP